jgi:hypothetical protein
MELLLTVLGSCAHVIGFGVGGIVSAVVKLQTGPVFVPLEFLSVILQ